MLNIKFQHEVTEYKDTEYVQAYDVAKYLYNHIHDNAAVTNIRDDWDLGNWKFYMQEDWDSILDYTFATLVSTDMDDTTFADYLEEEGVERPRDKKTEDLLYYLIEWVQVCFNSLDRQHELEGIC